MWRASSFKRGFVCSMVGGVRGIEFGVWSFQVYESRG